jgi:hypothetical protein
VKKTPRSAEGKKPKRATASATREFSKLVGRALRRAAKRARETARLHGTKIYIEVDGKIMALEP